MTIARRRAGPDSLGINLEATYHVSWWGSKQQTMQLPLCTYASSLLVHPTRAPTNHHSEFPLLQNAGFKGKGWSQRSGHSPLRLQEVKHKETELKSKKEVRRCRSASSPLLEDTVKDFKSDVREQQVVRPRSVVCSAANAAGTQWQRLGKHQDTRMQCKSAQLCFHQWAQRPVSSPCHKAERSIYERKNGPPEPIYNAVKGQQWFISTWQTWQGSKVVAVSTKMDFLGNPYICGDFSVAG